MYRKLTNLLVILLISTTTFAARNNNTITGKVIEKDNGKALSYATISVHDKDSKVVGGAISNEEGKFTVEKLMNESYKVKISFIGFKDTTILIKASDSQNVNLGTIALSPDATTLKSAVVTAKIPVIEQKLDKIVMNVSEAVSTQGSTALDILRKAPGISIDPSGNVLLNGNSVQVWIDNRPSNLSGQDLEALLSGTDGSTIDKIEIIAHPSAKYDAEGSSGIINIRTRKNFAKGLSGSLRGSYDASPYNSELFSNVNGTVNLNYRSDKTNTSVSYSPKYEESYDIFKSTTDLGSGLILKGETLYESINKRYNYRLSHDYFINKKSVIGVIVSGLGRNDKDNTNDDVTGSTLSKNGSIIQTNKTAIDSKSNFDNIYTNLNFTHTFKDNQELTLNADYGYYDIGSFSYQENHYFNSTGGVATLPEIFRSDSKQYLNIYSAKADYEQIIFKKVKMEAGAKFAESLTDNDLLRENKISGNWTKDNDLSSLFNYKENIIAAYLSGAIQLSPKVSAKAGLRAEYTISNGDWISADTTTTKKYVDIFPTAFIGYNPNKNLMVALTYDMRIQRPNFNQLNPFRVYVDANSSLEGNPNLTPQYTHQTSLSFIYKQHFSVGLHGQFSTNTIIQNTNFNPETGAKYLYWDNFGKLNFYGGFFNITELGLTKWLTLNAGLFAAYVTNKTEGYEKESFFSSLNLNTTVTLPKDTKIEVSGFTNTGMPYGYFKVEPLTEVDLGIKKGMLKNKGTLALNVFDIFNTMRSRASIDNGMINGYSFCSKWKSQRISLSFTYRFGNGKAAKVRKVGESEEAKRAESDTVNN
ncbi:MAG: TonB-dependent receptor [Bacteroidales bacterium]|nr:TonB-dependent receptor [Bacteroidales bacterium]